MAFGISAAAWLGAAATVGGAAISGAFQSNDNENARDAAAAANARGTVPDYAMPFVQDGLDRAKAVSQQPYTPYTGQLTAGDNQLLAGGRTAIQNWAGGTPQSTEANAIFKSMANDPYKFSQTPEFSHSAPAGFTGVSAVTSDYNKADAHTADWQGATTRDATAQGYNPAQASTTNASNGYLGATSQGIQGVGSIGQAGGNNPFLGQSAGQITGAPKVSAGTNAMLGMDNPYLKDQIDFASGDVTRNYSNVIAPRQDTMMSRSGSYGNTGLMAQQSEDARNLAGELGRVSSNMRMQDYGNQQQLQEADVNRRLGADQYNANNVMNTQQFNAGMRQNDLSRNLAGAFQQQGMGLDAAKFDAGNQMATQQFNAGLGASDLARNSGFAQQLGQFNASNANANSQFNAGAQNQAGQFGAAASNAANQNNASAFNANSQYNSGAFNQNALANAGILNNNSQYNANQGNEMARYNGTNMQNAVNFNSSALNRNAEFNAGQQQNMSQYNTGQANNMSQWNGNMAASQQAAGLGGLLSMDSRGLAAGNALGALGTQQRGFDQQGLDAQYGQFLRQQGFNQQQIDSYINNVRGLTFGSPTQAPQTQSVAGAALGGASAGYGIYKGLLGGGIPTVPGAGTQGQGASYTYLQG